MSLFDHCLPHYAEGTVVSGFGRGSKELGIPTANFPEDVVKNLPETFQCGVYYGWAKISSIKEVFKMTMSVGWNPYYHNTVKTMETHILHKFDEDFYGDHLKVIVLGYIRDMLNFKSLDDLIAAIKQDIEESDRKLEDAEFKKYKDDKFFKESEVPRTDVEVEQLQLEPPISSNHLMGKGPYSEEPPSCNIHTENCQTIDLEKAICNGEVNGSSDSHESKEMCISNLKLKNSLCFEHKLESQNLKEPDTASYSCHEDNVSI